MSAAFPAISYTEATRLMLSAVRERLSEPPPLPHSVKKLRCPVGFLFLRGDREGAGSQLAREMIASFGYLGTDSGRDFDFILPGWEYSRAMRFHVRSFLAFRSRIESLSQWRYSGETELLLCNFDYDVAADRGQFTFDEVMVLPVEQMIREGRVPHLDHFFHQLIQFARSANRNSSNSVVWQISDRFGIHRGGKLLWDFLANNFIVKTVTGIFTGLRPFAVCDLRIPNDRSA